MHTAVERRIFATNINSTITLNNIYLLTIAKLILPIIYPYKKEARQHTVG
ncbi:hypothetical protein SA21204_2034 [Staphylococcus aureus subsp. aureus 21204]|nr:predicted protein [Staphylococcus aureus subsp. aureus D139]EFC08032.1 predicted protein [Staphylococcus aureus subsp. aureus H19]TID10015.1 hypothetical protein SA21204_2034 [Staphylococcus aureus subsp. aureus 21204]HDI6818141.1 hypothetical protein [Staphylococcus aureus]